MKGLQEREGALEPVIRRAREWQGRTPCFQWRRDEAVEAAQGQDGEVGGLVKSRGQWGLIKRGERGGRECKTE